LNRGHILFLCLGLAAAPVLPPAEAETGTEGLLILRSYHHTFPEKTGAPFETSEGWAIRAGTEIFYWADGRLLPSSLLGEREKWKPHDFSLYPREVPQPERSDPAGIERLRQEGNAEARLAADDRYYGFVSALYGGALQRQIEAQLVRVNFLGRNISVHSIAAEPLKRVDAALKNLAEREDGVRGFIESIGAVDSYNWRQIRGTRRMSYHSWGLAVDIRPENAAGAIYWLWEQEYSKDWMLIPPEERWQPPAAVIEAFENEGFIWGGKWELYDNMHFEFRPELHELNRILAAESGPEQVVRTAESKDLHHVFPLVKNLP
jgi:hypothetical protein